MFIRVDLPAPFSPSKRVHLALQEIEADVVVRDDAREALRDVAHLEDLAARRHVARFYSAPTGRCPAEVGHRLEDP